MLFQLFSWLSNVVQFGTLIINTKERRCIYIKYISYFVELLSQTWNIYGVSTLFNFCKDEVHLKQYAKRLREEVAGTLTQQDVSYNAKFFVMENITVRPHPVDPPPIKVSSVVVIFIIRAITTKMRKHNDRNNCRSRFTPQILAMRRVVQRSVFIKECFYLGELSRMS